MKRVAITQRLVSVMDYNEIRTSLDIRWTELLLAIDLIPIPVPFDLDLNLFAELGISGIILTGGNDLSIHSDDELSILRDNHERSCIDFAIENSIPVLGVCRGMQLIADYFGSTFVKVEHHVATKHKLDVIGNSIFKSFLKKADSVNSFHNYAIDKLGEGLNKVAIAPEDGVLEAIGHSKYNIFGQMWHPERDNPFNKYNLDLMRSLFNTG